MSPDDARRLLGARASRRVSAVVATLGSINILLAVGLDLRTFIAPIGPRYEGAFLPSFLLAFALSWWTVLLMMALAGGTRRGFRSAMPRWADTFGRLPSFVPWTLAAAALIGLVSAGTGISATAEGQPTFVPATGQYTLNNHGSVRTVTRAVYEQALAGVTRLFLCGAILFSCLAVAVALNHCQMLGRPRGRR